MCGRRYADDKTVCPDDGETLLDLGPSGGRSSALPSRTSHQRIPTQAPIPASVRPPKASGSLVVQRPMGSNSLIGATIAGRFVIEAKIGSGGMGVVYRARQLIVDRTVALKIPPRDLAEDPASMQRFTNEAKAISQLRHPNVVTLYDFGVTEDGRPFIAMEFVAGETLTEVIKRGPVPLHTACSIVAQICEALAAAHDMGLIHRDIKADNIMIERRTIGNDQVRVLDFGIVRTADSDQRLTQTGVVYATPQYCSPEQALALPLDHRSDLYSVGVLFFEMLAARLPFIDRNGGLLLHKHINEMPPRLREIAPELNIPQAIDRLVDGLLSKDRERRPANARAFIATLAAVLAGFSPDDELPSATPTLASAADFDEAIRLDAEPTANGFNGEREATPTPRSMPAIPAPKHSRAALWLAMGVGGMAAAGALLLYLDPSDEGTSTRPVPASRTAAAPVMQTLPPPQLPTRVASGAPMPASVDASPRPTPAAPSGELDPRLVAGVKGDLSPPTVPIWLYESHINDPIPLPAGLELPTDAAALPARIAAIAEKLAALPPNGEAHASALLELAAAHWASANNDFRQARAAYEREANEFLANPKATVEPKMPRPIYGDASPTLDTFVKTHPNSPQLDVALYYAGQAALSAGRRAEAIASFERLVRERPDSPLAEAARLPLADDLFDGDKFAEARTQYASLVRVGPEARRRYARFMLGYAAYGAGDFETAAQSFQDILQAPDSGSPEADKIYRDSANGALTVAFARLPGGEQRALDFYRGQGVSGEATRRLLMLGALREARDDVDGAIAAYAKLLADSSTDPAEAARLANRCARLEMGRNKPDAALGHFDRLLGGPGASDSLKRLAQAGKGKALLQLGRTAEGRALLSTVLAAPTAPGDVEGSEAHAVAQLALLDEELAGLETSPSATTERQMRAALADLDAQAKVLEKKYQDVAALGLPSYVAAAEFELGALAGTVSRRLAALADHPPTGLNAAGLDGWRLELATRIVNQREQARLHFERASTAGELLPEAAHWVKGAQVALKSMGATAAH